MAEASTGTEGEEKAPQQVGFFASLRYRGYLILWVTHITTSSQFWMEQVARPWLVYQMTDSVILLGAISAVRALPVFIFAGMAGVLADRVDRNKLLVVVRLVDTTTIVLLTALLLFGWLEVWHVFALTLIGGMANTMEFPVRQSIIPDLVPHHLLLNAIAINSVGRQFTHLAAPSVAGLLIASSGIEGCYVVQSIIAALSAVLTFWIRAPQGVRRAAHETVVQNLTGAVRYLRQDGIVMTLMVLALGQRLFTGSYQTMFPVFARDIFDVGEVGFGVLSSAVGGGAFLGALVIAIMGALRHQGTILLAGAVLQSIGLILFSFSPWFGLAVALTIMVGVVQTAYFTMNSSLLLARVSDEYRGRVLSLYEMDRGLIPLGTVALAWLTTVVGAPLAVALFAGPMIPLALGVFWRLPEFREAQ